ncbi:MAG: DUF6132 family protein [Bacteroidia bacterium]
MKSLVIKYKLELVGMLLGIIAGWCYWRFAGCSTGTCPITSSPINSSLYGALMGALFLNLFKKNNKS